MLLSLLYDTAQQLTTAASILLVGLLYRRRCVPITDKKFCGTGVEVSSSITGVGKPRELQMTDVLHLYISTGEGSVGRR